LSEELIERKEGWLRRNMKIDLKAKKTEAEWQKALDNFWVKATPRWFQWLGWLIILGAITFLSEQTKSLLLILVSGASYFMLFFYFQSFFFSLELSGFPFIKSERVRRLVSLIVSAFLSLFVWYFMMSLVSEIQGKV
jgi:cellulose synthase/poly-beta-1,6-N-acetylglucosamine synthase-like glycosyltransferase